MNLNLLQIFVQVAETSNITEASKALFISQPAVSKAIKNLEAALGIQLFIRDKHKGVLLTGVGREILVLARQMKAIENNIYQIAGRENRLLGGKVTIASFPAATTNLLSKAIAIFRANYPLVRIELLEGVSDQIKQWVEDRTVELGIVASPFHSFEFERLQSDYMVAIVPSDHPLAKEPIIDLECYRDDVIFCKGGHEMAMTSILREYRIELGEGLTVQSAETLIRMVRNGLGIGLISNFTLSSVPHDLVVKEIRPGISRDIGIVAHSFGEISPAATQLISILLQVGLESGEELD
ncbi:LysR family transcriptional regulator [Paenibacillus anseongense]|uniref:LysR family transcriptional regulator n=1 Tax=Paenibacillus anseongense TaxID=2682845 RepID=UPI002DB8D726|nr:LysR family transcriptional regulator [Paenibacillus anseongense]MEC0270447.1 LysR family transcriptional regulator [Paenibacillus anseongense]